MTGKKISNYLIRECQVSKNDPKAVKFSGKLNKNKICKLKSSRSTNKCIFQEKFKLDSMRECCVYLTRIDSKTMLTIRKKDIVKQISKVKEIEKFPSKVKEKIKQTETDGEEENENSVKLKCVTIRKISLKRNAKFKKTKKDTDKDPSESENTEFTNKLLNDYGLLECRVYLTKIDPNAIITLRKSSENEIEKRNIKKCDRPKRSASKRAEENIKGIFSNAEDTDDNNSESEEEWGNYVNKFNNEVLLNRSDTPKRYASKQAEKIIKKIFSNTDDTDDTERSVYETERKRRNYVKKVRAKKATSSKYSQANKSKYERNKVKKFVMPKRAGPKRVESSEDSNDNGDAINSTEEREKAQNFVMPKMITHTRAKGLYSFRNLGNNSSTNKSNEEPQHAKRFAAKKVKYVYSSEDTDNDDEPEEKIFVRSKRVSAKKVKSDTVTDSEFEYTDNDEEGDDGNNDGEESGSSEE